MLRPPILPKTRSHEAQEAVNRVLAIADSPEFPAKLEEAFARAKATSLQFQESFGNTSEWALDHTIR